MTDLKRMIVEDFLKTSRLCVEVIVEELTKFRGNDDKIHLYSMQNGQLNESKLGGEHFFLRTSVEYSNPQLTVEEVQGILSARMLEVCGNYFYEYKLNEIDRKDIDEICERLTKPSKGKIVPFLLNTDEVEPDRYSMNPLKESIVNSGQSAFPAISVKTQELDIDKKFVNKYEGSLISRDEIELIKHHLEICKNNYLNMVDALKFEQLEFLSESFGINLSLYFMRIPLTILEKEATDGLLHYIISESHKNYSSFERVYNCMGRSMKSLTTLLTTPHSEKGYGSKRAAKGRIYFESKKLKRVKVTYKTKNLYPNGIDPDDISVVKANDQFTVDGERLASYNFIETPSSPQFLIHSITSPENAAIWHGIGKFGASQLVRSYVTLRYALARETIFKNITKKYRFSLKIPLQFNLIPSRMWGHPIHDNIDASIGCVDDLNDLAKMGMGVEHLSTCKFIRNLR